MLSEYFFLPISETAIFYITFDDRNCFIAARSHLKVKWTVPKLNNAESAEIFNDLRLRPSYHIIRQTDAAGVDASAPVRTRV